MYNYKLGVPLDFGKAMEYYLKAADQGDGNACFNIGIFHFVSIYN